LSAFIANAAYRRNRISRSRSSFDWSQKFGLDLFFTIARAQFEGLCSDFFKRVIFAIQL